MFLRKYFLILLALCGDAALAAPLAAPWIPAADSRIQVWGRHVLTDSGSMVADWPATTVVLRFKGTGITAKLAGAHRYEIRLDGKNLPILTTQGDVKDYELAKGLELGVHTLILARRTEALGEPEELFAVLPLGPAAELLAPPSRPQRRIEFIGDSYTVGYGNESVIQTPNENQVDSLVFATTNSQKSFAMLVGKRLGAEVQINAISGRGLVRNFNGFDPGQEFGYFYRSALLAPRLRKQNNASWDFASWQPQVIVIGLGINDWQGQPPYPDSLAFDAAYHALLDSLRVIHPGVKLVLCATGVWPTEALIPRVKAIVAAELAQGKKDVRYFEFSAEKSGLWYHPSLADHEAIAAKLVPVVTELGGWRSR